LTADSLELRIQRVNEKDANPNRRYVLYWMIANRRTTWNFSLQRAAWWAEKLERPLVVFEALRVGYPWASDRLHHFVLQGMHDNYQALQDAPVTYYPYVEPEKDAAKGLLQMLAKEACVVVTDDFPCFFLPRMVKAVAKRIDVQLEAIDSNGLLPMRAADRDFPRAYSLRKFLHKQLRPHLDFFPNANPFDKKSFPAAPDNLVEEIQSKWKTVALDDLADSSQLISNLPIDHHVKVIEETKGGSAAAGEQLEWFLKNGLPRYADDRNQVDEECVSQLSPYLHFGHISAHEIFQKLVDLENWSPSQLSEKGTGSREGWWNMSPGAESFLDELITWRELGYNMCHMRDDYDQYDSLPEWARTTLEEHANDEREAIYSLEKFEKAETHDELWNAAQRQLVREGRIHNYLRMLWGKKVLHWSESPQQALQILIELNNKYALDGRNPNSYSGIFWCLGRYDRAWGPERDVFGKIRYMSCDSARNKLKLSNYLEKYASNATSKG